MNESLEQKILQAKGLPKIVLGEGRYLSNVKTAEKTHDPFQSHEKELVNKYNSVVNIWRRAASFFILSFLRSISANSGELRYLDSFRLMNTLETESRGFVDLVNTTIAAIHPIQCVKQRKVHVIWDTTTVSTFLVVAGVLFIFLKPKRPKPKTN